jgi:hypothetical protein
VWSLSSFRGDSTARAEATVVSIFSMILDNCHFFGAKASTITTGGAALSFPHFTQHKPLAHRTSKAECRYGQLDAAFVVFWQQCEKLSAYQFTSGSDVSRYCRQLGEA